MTPQRAKELIPILQAIERGETVQHRNRIDAVWYDRGSSESYIDCRREYRIKPKPKFRAWTMNELNDLPIDTLFNDPHPSSNWGNPLILDRVHGCGLSLFPLFFCRIGFVSRPTLEHMMKEWQYSTDHGLTWKPCGVEVNEP